MAVRVLFAGACNGDWKGLFNRVSKVNQSKGPFDALFCFGNFFPGSAQEEDSSQCDDLRKFLGTLDAAPVDTYFIGAFGQGSETGIQMLSAENKKISYLGKMGVAKIKGLSVAFLDGVYDADGFASENGDASRYYTKADISKLKELIHAWEGDIDVMLTCEWPHGVLNGVAKDALEALPEISGSSQVSEVIEVARPRYHFASDAPVHFTRAPYINPDLGVGTHVTRFISLAPFGIPKQKALTALQLVPADQMDPQVLHAIPPDSTTYPYPTRSVAGVKRAYIVEEEMMQPWRWQQPKRQKTVKPSLGNPSVVKDRRKTCFVSALPLTIDEADVWQQFSAVGEVTSIYRGTNADGVINTWAFIQYASTAAMREACRKLNNVDSGGGRNLRVEPAATHDKNMDWNPEKPVEGCWFCLGSSASDKGLVASVGSECYIAVDKGPISDDHVLIIPTSHHRSTLEMPQGVYTELQRYLSALKSMFAASGRGLVAFERFIRLKRAGGNHSILSVISIPSEKEEEAKGTFMKMCKAHGLDLTCLEGGDGSMDREAIRDLVGDEEYFMAIMPDGTRLIRPITRLDRLPIAFGREVFASLVGKPDRTNWKVCVGAEEEEKARVDKFRRAFAPFDIMNNGDGEDGDDLSV